MRTDHQFATRQALLDALAESLVGRLGEAVRVRGQAVIAVSGGQSPRALFEQISRHALSWERVTVTQVDERWIDPAHADSNARLIREHLLVGHAATARFVGLKNSADTPEAGRASCESNLQALALPFDVVILGMGDDGHTASLFPGAAELAVALDTSRPDLCTPAYPPAAPYPRMSLTLRGLLCSRVLVLPLAGGAKISTLRKAEEQGPVEQMPIRAILRQLQVPIEIWSTVES
jgi:6-phosphogluconolactonase